MPWTAPMTFVAGTPLPASDLNTHLRDNTLALRAGAIATSGQEAGAVMVASSSTQLVPRTGAAMKHWVEVFCG